jgi:hypothetical protein
MNNSDEKYSQLVVRDSSFKARLLKNPNKFSDRGFALMFKEGIRLGKEK